LTYQLDQISEKLTANADAALKTLYDSMNTKLGNVEDAKKKIQAEFDQLTREKEQYENAQKA
jgi:hypothetical protein